VIIQDTFFKDVVHVFVTDNELEMKKIYHV